MKRLRGFLPLLLIFLVGAAGQVSAQQITKIAIIDLSRVYSVYYMESQELRKLEEMKESFQEEIDRIREEIQQLEEQKLTAENRGDEEMALQIDDEIFKKQQYLKNYIRVKNNQLKETRESLTRDQQFLEDILAEISNVAESQGYSAVFRASDPNLYWWSQEVDITEEVIRRLMERTSGQ